MFCVQGLFSIEYLYIRRYNSITMGKRGTEKSDPGEATEWVGPVFSKKELERIKKAGVKYITVNRGGGRFPVDKLVAAEDRDYKGKRSSARGTSSK